MKYKKDVLTLFKALSLPALGPPEQPWVSRLTSYGPSFTICPASTQAFIPEHKKKHNVTFLFNEN